MKLYHFTSGRHLPAIGQHGLTVGDVPTDLAKGRGVVGVWLTDAETSKGHGLEGSSTDKTRFRLSVDIPDGSPCLHRWKDWASTHVMRATFDALNRTAGGDPARWYVFFGWIKPERIIDVVDTATGEPRVNWSDECDEFIQTTGVRFRDKDRWHRRLLRDVLAAASVQTAFKR